MVNEEILLKLDLIAKLLYLQCKQNMMSLEKTLIKTDKQKKLYHALDGKRNMDQLQKLTDVSVKTMEPLLPEWEKQGLIISSGKGKNKRYLNLINMEI
jgi:predicted transcriptional regulator